MTFSSLIRHLQNLPLSQDLRKRLTQRRQLSLSGLPRLPKGLITSSLAQSLGQNLLVVTATLEEAGRWAAQLELMGWQTVNFYPTSEASPYETSRRESEMVWGQMQVLAELSQGKSIQGKAIVTTEKGLQPHLPPLE
ncbi:MAG: transcription-repair coupling factor, partial [Synechocystis sp.]|nr:transcription-repair coupling factor [Synechocystis sp.]